MEEHVQELENGTVSPSDFVATAFSDKKKTSSDGPEKVLELLSKRSRELERELRSAVCTNSDELLRNATDVKELRDNVTSLKNQIGRCRTEAKSVAAKLLDPFSQIQRQTIILNSSSVVCRKLRVLQRFVQLVKQSGNEPAPVSIPSLNNKIKKFCEIQRIAESGEINDITVFQRFWETMRPKCERMIETAEKQLTKAIEKNDSQPATAAAAVFLNLGRGETVSHQMYDRVINNILMFTTMNIQKSSPDTIVSDLRKDFRNMCTEVTRIATLHQAFRSALLPSSDIESTLDLTLISPSAAIETYSDNLKRLLIASGRQSQRMQASIVGEVPTIRKAILESLQKLPVSVEQTSAFATIVSAIVPFQSEFFKVTSTEMRTELFSFFNKDMRGGDPRQIALFFERLDRRFSKYDRELLANFRQSIIKLASDYQKLKNYDNPDLRNAAIQSNSVVSTGLRSLGARLFSEETAKEIDAILK